MKNEMVKALKAHNEAVKGEKSRKLMRTLSAIGASASAFMLSAGTTMAYAGFGDKKVSIKDNGDAEDLMGRVIGILLDITRYVGVALVVYGVYEIVMSFMQNQPEAKTKGVVMALAGVAMMALKSILTAMGVIG